MTNIAQNLKHGSMDFTTFTKRERMTICILDDFGEWHENSKDQEFEQKPILTIMNSK